MNWPGNGTFALAVIFNMMALRDLGAGRNWHKCSRTNGYERGNLTVGRRDSLVMVVVEHREKVIFNFCFATIGV